MSFDSPPAEPKFGIGDRVEITRDVDGAPTTGKVGTISEVSAGFRVSFDRGSLGGHIAEFGWWIWDPSAWSMSKKFLGKIDSIKLDTLPADLRKLADEVLAEKFG